MTLKEFEKKIHGIINDREKELEELNNKKVENEKKINEVKGVINKAKVDNNFKKHTEAKKKLGELENEQEFYKERITMLEEPTPHEEYYSYLDTLDELLGEEIEGISEELKPVIKQVYHILNKERDVYLQAKRLGELMQHTMMKNKVIAGGRTTEFRSTQKLKSLIAVEKCYYERMSMTRDL